MPNKIYIDVDETVDGVSIAEMQRSMLEASLMYPGCEFEMRRGSMRDGGDFRYGAHVNLYPEASSDGLYNLGGDQTSHIVMTRDELSYGEGLGYRSPSGDTRVVKTDLRSLDGLSSSERVDAFTRAINGEAARMTGRYPSLHFDSDVEALAAYEEVQRILEDDAAEPEETLEELDRLFTRYEKKGPRKRGKKRYYAAGEKAKPTVTQKPKQKKAQGNVSKPKPQPKKNNGKRKRGTLKIGEVTSLK